MDDRDDQQLVVQARVAPGAAPRGLESLLARRVFGVPLAVTPRKAVEILGALGPWFGYEMTAAAVPAPRAALEFDGRRRDYAVAGGVAIIPVMGTLVHRATGMDALSGLVSVERLTAQVRAAIADPEVDGILLDVDSDGGEVSGIADLADVVRSARGEKPVWAVANEAAYSAAYWVAAAAERVVVPRTGGVGSIGVIAVHVDQSARDAAQGLRFTVVKAGALKDAFSSHAPLSEDGAALLQAEVDRIASLFHDAVAQSRGLAVAAVRGLEARTVHGTDAVTQGLADTVDTFDATLAALQAEVRRRKMMQGQDPGVLRGVTGMAEQGKDTEGKVVDLEAFRQQVRTEAHAETKAVEQARAKAITDLCLIARRPELAGGFIAEGLTIEAVQTKLLELRAADGDRDPISGHATGTGAARAAVSLDAREIFRTQREQAMAFRATR